MNNLSPSDERRFLVISKYVFVKLKIQRLSLLTKGEKVKNGWWRPGAEVLTQSGTRIISFSSKDICEILKSESVCTR